MSTTSPQNASPANPPAESDAPATGQGHPPPQVPGVMLRDAREKLGMSIGDLSMRLRMGVRQIEALERGDYSALPTGTFLRGFVRNYAKAVNADGEQAIRLLEQHNAEAARLKATDVVVPSQEVQIPIRGAGAGLKLDLPTAKIATVGGVVLLLAAASWYWWQFVRPHLPTGGRPALAAKKPLAPPLAAAPIAAAPEVVSVIESEPGVTGGARIDGDRVLAPGQVAASGVVRVNAPANAGANVPLAVSSAIPPAASSAVSPTASPTSPPAIPPKPPVPKSLPAAAGAAGGVHVLGFTFSGDSWVEVTDAGGRVLLSRQYHAGDAGEVRGTAPLSVVVGYAQVTRMADNGREIDLAPYTRVSVARVNIK